MICTKCQQSFELVQVGDIECPNCSARLHVHIGEFSTNVAEYKKYIYFTYLCFLFAVSSIPVAHSIGGKDLAISSILILVLLPNLFSAVFAGFIPSQFGPLLKASKPKTFALVTLVLVTVIGLLSLSVLEVMKQ